MYPSHFSPVSDGRGPKASLRQGAIMDLTIEQPWERQREVKPLAPIEPIDGKPESVKVAPWSRSRGCFSAYSLVIPKAAIASVKPTGELHFCCGKQFEVVEITFREDAQLGAADV